MGTHEQTTAHRDHLWVAVIIAACALLEVWATWLGLGSVSGFPKLGRMTTGWILPVTTEAYWGYALWSWLTGAPGRAKTFAMWTAGVMFLLSLLGQESGHLTSPAGRAVPPYVVALVTALPLIALALIAVLVHLRQADREEAALLARAAEQATREAATLRAEAERQAAVERAEADERTWLRAELDRVTASAEESLSALREELTSELNAERTARETAQQELESAQRDAAGALARAEKLDAKLAALSGQKPRRQPKATGASDALEQETNLLRAQMEIQDNPSLAAPRMGGELARKLGLGASTGRRLHGTLTENGRLKPEYERSSEDSGASAQGER
jgi:hypothetical protein